jgi:adenine phosphoribosyltransferase
MSEYKFVEIEPRYFTVDPTSPAALRIAHAIRWYSPQFSPKAVPRFYDAGSLTENPEVLRLVIDVLVKRYNALPEAQRPTHILGYDARGFLLGTPLALGLNIPFVMLRKDSKSPGVLVRSTPYSKEYVEAKDDTMVLRVDSVGPGARVVLIDDLIATGGTAVSGFELCKNLGVSVVEFAAIIGIPILDGVRRIHEFHDGEFKNVSIFTLIHDTIVPASCCADPKGWPADKPRVVTAAEAPAVRAEILADPSTQRA